MKPEIIDYNKFICGMDRAYLTGIVPYYTCCRNPMKWTKGFMLFCNKWLIGIYPGTGAPSAPT
jgi:hypothetical protein